MYTSFNIDQYGGDHFNSLIFFCTIFSFSYITEKIIRIEMEYYGIQNEITK